MTEQPQVPDASAPDWEAFIRKHEAAGLPEIDLATVKAGDRILVLTQRTGYVLAMGEKREAELTTNRSGRPAGRVVVHGCAFGASSSIRPDRLFCGGNLEFAHGEPRMIYRTTAIRALQLLQASPA